MKKIINISLILFSTTLFAQIKITGKIVTKDNIPITSIETILVNKDSLAVKSELTNEKGEFFLEAVQGFYTLQIRQNAKIVASQNIELITDKDLGQIFVNEAIELESVVVAGTQKKLIERKIDRVVFNVENSISSAGGNALTALSVTPGVRVQNDNISIIGKSTLAVLVDDKIVQLSGEDLTNYLKTIHSDAIQKIEVITTPPAKYEAEGNSGLVNIIMKKAKENSWNALLQSTYIQKTYAGQATMGSFNYNKNKLSFSSVINYRDITDAFKNNQETYFPDNLWYSSNPFKINAKSLNLNVGANYKIKPWWTMGIQVLYVQNKRNFDSKPYTSINDYTSGNVDSYLATVVNAKIKPNIRSYNFYNDFKLDTLGRKLTLNLDYFNFNNNDSRVYDGKSVTLNPEPASEEYYTGENSNIQDITNLSGKVDVEYPTKWAKWSYGGKISSSKSKNDIYSFNSGVVENPVSDFPLTYSKFEYTENIQSAYVSLNKKINKSWESQFGLRMEATQTEAFAEKLGTIENNYLKLFPTFYLAYTINDNSSLNINYSKRISRPGFAQLNPNIFFSNPFQSQRGNPLLQPAFIDNVDLNYTFKHLDSKVYFSYSNNLFAGIDITDPTTNTVISSTENYLDTQRYGVYETYSFTKFKWWESSFSLDVNYSVSKSRLAITAQEQKGFNSSVSLDNQFTLNSKKTVLFFANYWYDFPGINGIYKNKAVSNLSAGFQYLLMDKNLKISLNVNDIFKTAGPRTSATVNNILNKTSMYLDSRNLQFSVSYKFGNSKIKAQQRQTGNQEERRRTGN
ncbi:outer membrane beta-barrel protein [Flavobacterium sp. ZT3R18]|uniref:outer membrane beta-barrel family protein n=1 Tax=Flavobacterium sp. ZT3R18 TaxID=2594429 RepID=UPI00117B02E1|nr:outer membrane beta-barrel family protein [Flavobacterium sp. ZT3R18]TRX33011.1 outer membrane beta-barrel protein [Flavobacterium sp. ZT3R18]